MNKEIKHYYAYHDWDKGHMVVREYTKGEPIKCGTEIKKHGMSIFIASPRIHFTSEEPHMFLLDGMKNHDDEDDAWQHFLDEELDSYYRE